MKALQVLPKPLKDSHKKKTKQTNKQNVWTHSEHSGIPIFRTSKRNEIWFEKLEVPKLEGLL